jgi:hypothetical protein
MDFFILCTIILLPIVPAYLLFRILPSTAELSGPFQGMEIKLGGSFAGYFALVLLVIFSMPKWHPPKAYEVWQVEGRLVDADGGSPVPQPLDIKDVGSVPPLVQFVPDGSFKMYFVPIPGQAGGVAYPTIIVGHDKYSTMTIPLDPSHSDQLDKGLKLTRDPDRRSISLHDIYLHKLQPYAATGPPPQQVSAVKADSQ